MAKVVEPRTHLPVTASGTRRSPADSAGASSVTTKRGREQVSGVKCQPAQAGQVPGDFGF